MEGLEDNDNANPTLPDSPPKKKRGRQKGQTAASGKKKPTTDNPADDVWERLDGDNDYR